MDAVDLTTGYNRVPLQSVIPKTGQPTPCGPVRAHRAASMVNNCRGKSQHAPTHVLDRIQRLNGHFAHAIARAGVPDAPALGGCADHTVRPVRAASGDFHPNIQRLSSRDQSFANGIARWAGPRHSIRAGEHSNPEHRRQCLSKSEILQMQRPHQ